MDSADQKFSRNVLRLALLTQEDLQRCIDEQKRLETPVSLREIALGLGLLSVKDAQRASHDADPAALERQSLAPRPRLKSVVEEVSARPDPRAEGGPAPRKPRARPQTGRTEQSLTPVRAAPPPVPAAPVPPPPIPSQAPSINRRWDAASAPVREGEPPSTTRANPNARWLDGATTSLAPTAPAAPSMPAPSAPSPPPPPEPERAPEAVAARAGALANATVMQAPAPIVSFAPLEAPRALTEPPPPPASEPAPRDDEPYLVRAVALAIGQGASDLHLHSGAPLMIRMNGRLVPISGVRALAPAAAAHVVTEIMTEAQREALATRGEVEFSWTAGPNGRCRVSAYRQQHGIDAVLRIVPAAPQRPADLGLPAALSRLVALRSGLVVCAGPPGSGRSTTLAALLAERIASRADHVVSIEAPIEHVLGDAKGFVTQREIGPHAASFPRALRAALREDPDVIALGELPDSHTIELALAAADTERLVFVTLGTTSARQALTHLTTSFPAHARDRVRAALATRLAAIVTQHLVPHAKGGGRSVAVELLFVTEAVREVIRKNALHELDAVMKAGREDGTLTLDASLDELARQGAITAEQARRHARDHATALGALPG